MAPSRSTFPVADVAPANIGRPVAEYAPCGLEILSDESAPGTGRSSPRSLAVKVEPPAAPLLADPGLKITVSASRGET